MPVKRFIIAIISTLAAATSAATSAGARDNPFPEIMTWPMPQATIMQRDFGSVATCSGLKDAYTANGWPSGVSFDALQAIDKRLKQNIFLRPDQGRDTWTPLTRTVIEGGRRPAADCDDVAVTSTQLAICAGFPSDRLGLLVTELPSRQGELHLVAFYTDAESGVYVFGDTMGKPRAFSNLNQRVHYYAYVDNVTEWWALRDPDTGKILTGSIETSSIPAPDMPLDPASGSCPHLHAP